MGEARSPQAPPGAPRSTADVPSGAGSASARHAYWRANLRLIALLLSVWAAVSYGCGILLVEPLNRFHLGGFPLGFWFAQQGAIYVFVALVAVYAVAMDRIDRRHGVDGLGGAHDAPGAAAPAAREPAPERGPAEAGRAR